MNLLGAALTALLDLDKPRLAFLVSEEYNSIDLCYFSSTDLKLVGMIGGVRKTFIFRERLLDNKQYFNILFVLKINTIVVQKLLGTLRVCTPCAWQQNVLQTVFHTGT